MNATDLATLVGVGLTFLGVLVGLAGLKIASDQLRLALDQMERTASAADAAREAMDVAQRRFFASQALLLLPRLRHLEAQLEAAVAAGDSPAARGALVEWRDAASQVATFLSAMKEPDADLSEKLDRSVLVVARAKGALFRQETSADPPKPMADVTKSSLDSMGVVCSRITKLTDKFMSDLQGGTDA